jgi:quinol monooxygenase YgiN
MFARILEITPKLEKKDELIKTIRQEILPILKEQPGFLEVLPFVPEIAKEKMVAITLWTEKRKAEKYVNEVFPKVEQILQPFLVVPVTVRTYTVETTLCRHFVEALTAVV